MSGIFESMQSQIARLERAVVGYGKEHSDLARKIDALEELFLAKFESLAEQVKGLRSSPCFPTRSPTDVGDPNDVDLAKHEEMLRIQSLTAEQVANDTPAEKRKRADRSGLRWDKEADYLVGSVATATDLQVLADLFGRSLSACKQRYYFLKREGRL